MTILLGVWACNSNNLKEEIPVSESPEQLSADTSVIKSYFIIPSPVQISSIMKSAGLKFNKAELNEISNEKRYLSNFKRSANIGVYGTDLCFSVMFGQTQESLNYLSVLNRMGERAGMSEVFFNSGLTNRFKENIANKDSLLTLLSDFYRISDDYFKTNNQDFQSSVIISGGWIEALSIATGQLKGHSNSELRKLIAEQKLSLNNIVRMLPVVEESAEYKKFRTDLIELNTLFGKVSVNPDKQEIQTDTALGMTTISGENYIEITDSQLNEITEKVSAIRIKLIN